MDVTLERKLQNLCLLNLNSLRQTDNNQCSQVTF